MGLEVKTLKRTRIGRLDIRGLGPGQWRLLTGKEIEQLRKLSHPSSKSDASEDE